MVRSWFCAGAFLLIWAAADAQAHSPSKMTIAQQRLLLEQVASFIVVKRLAVIDIDSGLTLVHQYFHIPRTPAVLEGFDSSTVTTEAAWIDGDDPGPARRRLTSLKGTDRVRQLVLLGAYYTFRPNAYRPLADSAISYLLQARRECATEHLVEWDRRALCLLGKVYEESWDTTKANDCFQQLIDDCRRSGDGVTEARAWKFWGAYYPYIPTTGMKRIACLRQALSLYRRQGDRYNSANVLMDLGYLSYSQFLLPEAKAAFAESVSVQDSIGWPYVHYSTDLLALIGVGEGSYGDQLRNALRSVRSAETAGDSLGLSVFYSRLATAYSGEDFRQQTAVEWDKKALDMAFSQSLVLVDQDVYSIAQEIVNYLAENGKTREAEDILASVSRKHPPSGETERYWLYLCQCTLASAVSRYPEAERYGNLARQIEPSMEKVSGPINTGYTSAILGSIYFNEKRYAPAEKMLREYLLSPHYRHQPNAGIVTYVLSLLVRIDSINNDAVNAVRDYRRYTSQLTDHYNLMQSRQGEQLVVEYETEKRERDIQLLRTRTTLQEAELRHTAFARTIAVTGAGFALLLAALAYSRYKIKQRSNEQLQKQKAEIDGKNGQLEALVREKDALLDTKEWLLREVHHRVKNNLQIMISLLNLQSTSLTGHALAAVRESRNRLYAMSIIHQMLYNPDNSTLIDMKYYAGALAQYMEETFGPWENIRIELDLQPIKLEVTQAIAVGLILNEAMTNSLKYAFGDVSAARPGILSVMVRQQPDADRAESTNVIVRVRDNGPGIPEDIRIDEETSLGLSLIHMLVDDLCGTLAITNEGGAVIEVCFSQLEPLGPEMRLIPA